MIKKMIILFVVTGGYHRCNSGWPLSAFLHLLKTCQGNPFVKSLRLTLCPCDLASLPGVHPGVLHHHCLDILHLNNQEGSVSDIVGVHSFSLAKLNQPSTNPPSPCNLRLLPGLLPHSFKPY